MTGWLEGGAGLNIFLGFTSQDGQTTLHIPLLPFFSFGLGSSGVTSVLADRFWSLVEGRTIEFAVTFFILWIELFFDISLFLELRDPPTANPSSVPDPSKRYETSEWSKLISLLSIVEGKGSSLLISKVNDCYLSWWSI